jgi:ATP:corrinoid adenosyltransferase
VRRDPGDGLGVPGPHRTAVLGRAAAARRTGAGVILTQVLAGGGGVGKTQLAARFAHQSLRDHTADLVIWVDATRVEQVITAYAQAADLLQIPGAASDDPVADATALLGWLATTDRSWLVVLDDLTDPAGLRDW